MFPGVMPPRKIHVYLTQNCFPPRTKSCMKPDFQVHVFIAFGPESVSEVLTFLTLMHTGSSPDPAFIVQPLNITVQPINGVMRGAFSCSVFPADDVQSITWYSGTTPLSNSDPDVVVESAGGISVLVLDSVGMEQEGPYHCEVVMNSGNDLVSETAYLQYNGQYIVIYVHTL